MARKHLIFGVSFLTAAIIGLVAMPALAWPGGHGGGGGGGGHGGGGGGFGGFSGGSSHMSSGGPHISSSGPSSSSFFSGGASGKSFSPLSSSHSFSSQGFNNSGAMKWNGNSSWAQGGNSWNHSMANWNHGESFAKQSWQNGNWNKGNWNSANWNKGNWNGQNWHGENWHNGNWHDHDHFHDGFFFASALWWPAAWYGGFGYGDGYSCYDTPYGYSDVAYATPVIAQQTEPVQASYAPESYDEAATGSTNSGAEFFTQAEAAFQAGKYSDALRLATHAAVESPQNPKAHELMSLALFASADYPHAAAEAHAAIALGPVADWDTLRNYYGDADPYTTQLRALEKFSHDNPTNAQARFLRAYQYMMLDHKSAAVDQLEEVVKEMPQDKMAGELLKKYGGQAAPVLPPPLPDSSSPAIPPPSGAGQGAGTPGGVDS